MIRFIKSLIAAGFSPGLWRSIFIYHGIPFRFGMLKRFYSQFIGPDSICIDVGSHIGNRVAAWRSLGARVVAIEPQANCISILNKLYSKDEQIQIIHGACGETRDSLPLYVCEKYPTLTSLSEDWIKSVSSNRLFENITWEQQGTIPVFPLAEIEANYGRADFIKIDVEGFELSVLKGLKKAPRIVSFEFLPANIDVALSCIDYLGSLADYEFNYSMVETMKFVKKHPVNSTEMKEILSSMEKTGHSGDVYAFKV